MKRKIIFLLILLGLVMLVTALIRMLSNRGPKQGELRVDSQPEATIFLDNKNIGKTPFRDTVESGEYTIKLVPESAVSQATSWEGRISVGQNLLTYVNAALSESELSSAVDVIWLEKITSKQSEISVTTSPDGSTVLIDDETRGVTPLSLADITPGDHMLSVTSTGFLSRSLKVKTTPGYRLIANFKLALSSGASPVVEESASPSSQLATTPTPSSSPASSSQTVDPPKPFVIIKETPTGFLRVRMEPSTSASEAGRVNPGEKYSYSDTQNGWYEIAFEGAKTGWVSGQYVENVE
jgi:uncharacterized protein YgiM (DUF1202 family)